MNEVNAYYTGTEENILKLEIKFDIVIEISSNL